MAEVHDAPHRALAVSAYNGCWDLLERPGRTESEDLDLLELAFASRHHWRAAGGPKELAISDWMVARCLAEVGDGPLSLRFANLAAAEQPADAPAWMRASMLEGLARAHAACGDQRSRDEAVALARAALAEERDDEERELIASQLATVPDAAN